MQDETFGPVVPIAVVDGEEEAIARANASRYGLTASIWTRDHKKGQMMARRLRAGVVTVNNHAFTGAIPAAPWSGRGETGCGITGSALVLDAIASSMATLRCSTRGLLARERALLALVVAMARWSAGR